MSVKKEIVEDFLTADAPIPGQNYVVLSCIWPEKVLKRKELYLIKHFLKDTLNDPLQMKRLFDNLEKSHDLNYEEIEDIYESYCLKNLKDIYKKFDEENDFRTSVRGVKIRGVYDTLKEARVRAEVLKRKDPNFETWLGQNGYWLPLEPSSLDDEIEQVYSNPQLNKLFSKKQDNTVDKETVFDPEVKAKMAAKRKEEELNQLVKTHQDNITSGKDTFEKETQRKKDNAIQETERRKAEQMRVKEEASKKLGGKKKNRKHKNKNKEIVTPDEPLPLPANGLPNRDTLVSQLRQTAERLQNPVTDCQPVEPVAPVAPVVPSNQEAIDKIRELRQILDEKEGIYQSVKDNQTESGSGVMSISSLNNTNSNNTNSDNTNLNNNMMLQSNRGPDIFDGQDADPWMQRKKRAEDLKLDTVIGKIL